MNFFTTTRNMQFMVDSCCSLYSESYKGNYYGDDDYTLLQVLKFQFTKPGKIPNMKYAIDHIFINDMWASGWTEISPFLVPWIISHPEFVNDSFVQGLDLSSLEDRKAFCHYLSTSGRTMFVNSSMRLKIIDIIENNL